MTSLYFENFLQIDGDVLWVGGAIFCAQLVLVYLALRLRQWLRSRRPISSSAVFQAEDSQVTYSDPEPTVAQKIRRPFFAVGTAATHAERLRVNTGAFYQPEPWAAEADWDDLQSRTPAPKIDQPHLANPNLIRRGLS